MGSTKNEQIKKQEDFKKMAERKGLTCSNCDNPLDQEEVTLGLERFDKPVCVDCMHAIDKMEAE